MNSDKMREQIADVFDDLCEPTNQFWHRDSALHYVDKLLALIASEVTQALNSIEVPEKKEEILHAGYEYSVTGKEWNEAIDLFQQAIRNKILEVSGE